MIVQSPEKACIFLVILNNSNLNPQTLSQWKSNGRNHVILDISDNFRASDQVSSAMIASTSSDLKSFRSKFDLTVSYFTNSNGISKNSVWSSTAHILPIRKHFLITFQGQNPKASEVDKKALGGFGALGEG